MFKLLIVGIYYLVRPRPLPYSPLPHLWLIILLLALVVGGLWNVETAHENALLSYSPPLSLPDASGDLTRILYATGDYELALRYYEAASTLPSPTRAWPTEVERHFRPNQILGDRLTLVEEQLEAYPTSRDLWLYKGWLSYLLQDQDKIAEAVEKLNYLDPNDPQVKEFLEQTQE